MSTPRTLDLDTGEIRLVSVLPHTTGDPETEVIELSLGHFPLGDEYFTPEYREWRANSGGDSVEQDDRARWYKTGGQ